MTDFQYKNGELHVESCSLSNIAAQVGTPAYVYSQATITRNYLDYANALGDHPGMICYAVKANSNLAVLQVLAKLGAGFDIVSLGELKRVLRAGGDPKKIIFSGVGKKQDEMEAALLEGIACFNVESEAEVAQLAEVAHRVNLVANISLRVNPDVDAQTHPYISTGLKENKFGVDIDKAPDIYAYAKGFGSLNIIGIDCHIGSQLTQIDPFLDALDRLLKLMDTLAQRGITISHLDLGGGIGVTYKDETPPNIHDYLAQVKAKIAGRNVKLMLEPGRSIVANAGAMLMRVELLKPTEHKNFAIVDGAMNDNIRPALYQAWQNVLPAKQTSTAEEKSWDIVGPVCETGDFLAKDRNLQLETGDLLALMSSGAYGFVMSSNYNSRGRACEVLVNERTFSIVRSRENFDDLVRGERLL